MQYVVMRDLETGEIDLLGRFIGKGIGEWYIENKWVDNPILFGLYFDGHLDEITEAEAERIIRDGYTGKRGNGWDDE